MGKLENCEKKSLHWNLHILSWVRISKISTLPMTRKKLVNWIPNLKKSKMAADVVVVSCHYVGVETFSDCLVLKTTLRRGKLAESDSGNCREGLERCWKSLKMANVRDNDTFTWLKNKLGTTTDTWTGSSICSQLNTEVLRNIKDCFPPLPAPVKLKLLLSFFHIPKRNVEEVNGICARSRIRSCCAISSIFLPSNFAFVYNCNYFGFNKVVGIINVCIKFKNWPIMKTQKF